MSHVLRTIMMNKQFTDEINKKNVYTLNLMTIVKKRFFTENFTIVWDFQSFDE